jgi:hypothetical protein
VSQNKIVATATQELARRLCVGPAMSSGDAMALIRALQVEASREMKDRIVAELEQVGHSADEKAGLMGMGAARENAIRREISYSVARVKMMPNWPDS